MQIIIVLCVDAFGCILGLCSPGPCNGENFESAKGTSKMTNKHFSEAFRDLNFRAKRMLNIQSPTSSIKTYGNEKDFYDDDDNKYDEDGKKLSNHGTKNDYIFNWNAVAKDQQRSKTLVRALKLGDDDNEVEKGDEIDGGRRNAHNFHGSLLKFRTNVAGISNFMNFRRDTDDNSDDEVEDDIGYDRKRRTFFTLARWWW